MLPRVTELQFETPADEEEVQEAPQPLVSFLFDFKKGDFVKDDGKLIRITGKEALKQWIEKTIRTERYRYRVYLDDQGNEVEEYGTTIEDLIGTNYPRSFVEAELEREITESLTNHYAINNIQNWRFERDDSTGAMISFEVVTDDEVFEQEVTL